VLTLLFKAFPSNFSPPSIASRRSSKLVNDSFKLSNEAFTVEATAALLAISSTALNLSLIPVDSVFKSDFTSFKSEAILSILL